jgi:hypothetical protein
MPKEYLSEHCPRGTRRFDPYQRQIVLDTTPSLPKLGAYDESQRYGIGKHELELIGNNVNEPAVIKLSLRGALRW